jgi:hypothetical protein
VKHRLGASLDERGRRQRLRHWAEIANGEGDHGGERTAAGRQLGIHRRRFETAAPAQMGAFAARATRGQKGTRAAAELAA